MNLLFIVCLVPLVLAWPKQDSGEEDGWREGMGRWKSDARDEMSEKYGQGKHGFFKMVGKVSIAKGGMGRKYDDEDEKPMTMRDGDDSREEGEGRWMGRRRDDGRDYRKQWSKRTEDNEDMDEHRGMGKWRRGDMSDDEDDEEHRKWEKMRGGKRGMGEGRRSNWGKSMVDEHSSEEQIKRAYVKFFGKVAMIKGKQAESEWKHGRDDDGNRRHHGGKWGWRGGKRYEDDDEEDDERMMDSGSGKMVEKKLKMSMKQLYKNDPHQLAKILTLSFLRMCECDGDEETRLLKQFLHKANMPEDKKKSNDKKVKLPEIPDFGADTTAKIEFLRKLSKEQKELLFGYDLIKNMCNGAKAYLRKSKEFYDKYFTMEDDTSKYTTETTP